MGFFRATLKARLGVYIGYEAEPVRWPAVLQVAGQTSKVRSGPLSPGFCGLLPVI